MDTSTALASVASISVLASPALDRHPRATDTSVHPVSVATDQSAPFVVRPSKPVQVDSVVEFDKQRRSVFVVLDREDDADLVSLVEAVDERIVSCVCDPGDELARLRYLPSVRRVKKEKKLVMKLVVDAAAATAFTPGKRYDIAIQPVGVWKKHGEDSRPWKGCTWRVVHAS